MFIWAQTILVAEDDSLLRRQISRVLKASGYNVSEACHGLEAIEILDARKIDLVLSDIRMPCLNGISLLKYVKIFHQEVPVVLVTAYPADITDELKPDALLCKPFGAEDLIVSVRRLLNGPKAWPPF